MEPRRKKALQLLKNEYHIFEVILGIGVPRVKLIDLKIF